MATSPGRPMMTPRQVWFWQPWKRAAIVAFLCCAHTRGICSSRSMRRSNRLEQVWDRGERSKKLLLTQTGALIRLRTLAILCQFLALLSEIRSPSMNRTGAFHRHIIADHDRRCHRTPLPCAASTSNPRLTLSHRLASAQSILECLETPGSMMCRQCLSSQRHSRLDSKVRILPSG